MKTDARVRYTRMRIQEAFFACLEEKPVSKITVKELCDKAEINRATFYTHYADPFDLLEKMQEDALEELRCAIEKNGNGQTSSLLKVVLGQEGKAKRRYSLLASAHGDACFASRMADLFYASFRPRIAEALPNRSENEITAAYVFITGGSGRLLSRWFQNGMDAPIEEVAGSLNKICEAFLRGYAESED